MVDGIIKKVLLELNTGSFGDGKIFVKDIENAVKIRTGETGEEAFIHLLFQYHPFYTGKRVLNRWDRNDDQCDTAFGQKISAVVNQ